MTSARTHIRQTAVAILLLPTVAVCVQAQTATRDSIAATQPRPLNERTHSTMLGGGFGNVLDTYLSPYSYTGAHARFYYENSRWTRSFRHDSTALPVIRFTASVDADGEALENPAGNVNEWAGGVRFSLMWQYAFRPLADGRLVLAAGPGISSYLGCVYNERNGNNPAQAKADLMLDATASACWSLRLFRRPTLLTARVAVPLAGVAFSPNYGQSYYEAFSLGNYDHNVVFAHPFNMPSTRLLLALDIPVGSRCRTAFRVGYAGQFMQTTFNHLHYHSYTHALMIGITKKFLRP